MVVISKRLKPERTSPEDPTPEADDLSECLSETVTLIQIIFPVFKFR
jgi:hypothetical protein